MVIKEQSQPQHPHRAHIGRGGQHESHRPHQVRRHAQHHLAFRERLAHETKPAVLEVTQSPVNEFGGGRGRAGSEVALLNQKHAQPTPGRVPRDAGPIDAATNDGKIEFGHIPSYIVITGLDPAMHPFEKR